MDDNTKILTEIRDLLLRNQELARAGARFYKRVVAVGAILVVGLIVYIFNLNRA
jgi:hypothetical protein